jgi:hypothetical protein
MESERWISCLVIVGAMATGGWGAQEPNESNYVTRQEYDALKKEWQDLKAALATRENAPASQSEKPDRLDSAVARALAVAEGSGLGDTKLLVTGTAAASYTDPEGASSTFGAEFEPMLLWQLNERLFFEGEVELELGESETETSLGAAYLAYLIDDYALAGGGKFAVPFTVYHNHLDAPWINRLPTDPLIYSDGGIAPDSDVGVFATGAVPCREALFNYACYVTNGPALITDDPGAAGSLDFDNFTDENNNKAVGVRVGWLPTPALEIGYSFQFSRPNPSGFQTVRSRLHGVDLNYLDDIEPLAGQLTIRGAWVWSNLDEATYDPTGVLGFGPLRFDNDRDGGYAEVAYRPTKAAERILRDFEFALRYDTLRVPSGAPGGGADERWIPGIDYWITPRTVLEIAYAFDDREDGEDEDMFVVQVATGF